MLTRPPWAGNCCCLLLTAPGRVRTTSLAPAVLAWKLRMQTTPVPFTPAAPGGREASRLLESL